MSDSSALDESRVAASDTPTDTPDSTQDSPGQHGRARITRTLIALPDRVVSTFLVAAIPVGLAVVFHVFVPAVVFPAAVVLVVALWRWTPSDYLRLRYRQPWWHLAADRAPERVTTGFWGPRPLVRQAAVGAVLAFLLILGWLWVNRNHLSAYLVLQRDPGIYTLRGLWLIHHSTPVMDSSQEALDAGGIPGVQIASLAFPSIGTSLYPQSSALLPGLLGTLGWFLGVRGVLAGNLLIGALALLSVYAFGRRLLGPLWALVPMVVLAACMPMVAFSRGAYSEPVALVSTFGGLTLLWIAWQTGKLGHFFAAGLLIGVGSLARIDGGVTLIGLLAGFAVVTLGARSRAVRIRTALACTAWALGAGALDGLSLIDGKINSPVYQSSEWHGILPLLVGTLVAFVVTVGLAFVPLSPLREMLARSPRQWSRWVLVLALVIGVVMISRPLWWVSRASGLLNSALADMQRGSGLPVDGTRTYSENSVSWLAMYLGWPTLVLAAIGAAMLLARTVLRRDPRLGVFTLTIGCVALLYLNQVSIFPDQIWAMRRFLPVVLPGVVIAVIYPISRLHLLQRISLRRIRPKVVGALAAVLVAGVVLSPVLIWEKSNLWGVGNVEAQIAEMQIACQAVGSHPVILAGPPPGSATFLPSFRAECGSEVIAYQNATQAGLAALRQRIVDPANGADTTEPVVVVFDPKSVKWQGSSPDPYLKTLLTSWTQPLQHLPETTDKVTRSMWIGTLTSAGLVVPISTSRTIVNGP